MSQIHMPTGIQWDNHDLKEAGQEMKKWARINNRLQKRDHKKTLRGVVNAYSELKVEEYVNFSKNFKPILQWDANVVDAMSPADQARCELPENQAKTADCLNTWMLGGFKQEDVPQREACFKAAGCENAWSTYTPQQKQELSEETQGTF